MSRGHELYRRIFVAAHGPLPHSCYFCGDPVTRWGQSRWEGGIHHVDGNHKNNSPTNLAAVHPFCHISYHSTARVMSMESNQRRSLAGRTKSPCPDCGVEYNPTWMTRHITIGKCLSPTPEQLAEADRQSRENAERARRQHAEGRVAPPYERTAEIRAKIAEGLRGQIQTPETRAKKAETARRTYAAGRKPAGGLPKGYQPRKVPCPYCGREIAANNLPRHVAVHADGRTPRVR